MTSFKKDDRVQVQYEAVVLDDGGHFEEVYVNPVDRHGPAQYVGPRHLTLIEPKYLPDAFYVAADGKVYRRTINTTGNDRWQGCSPGQIGNYYPHNRPVRPLRLLVPEG